MSKLKELHFGGNQIQGTVISELGLLTNLDMEALALYDSGTIPAEFEGLNLFLLDLSDKFLTGLVVSELGKVNNLRQLFLAGNNLTNFPLAGKSLTTPSLRFRQALGN